MAATVHHLPFAPPSPPPPAPPAPQDSPYPWTPDEVLKVVLNAVQEARLEARAECARLHGHGLRAVPSP